MSDHSREHGAGEAHGHSHGGGPGHGHTHGIVDPSLLTSERGIRVLTWSFLALFITAALQAIVVAVSGSVGLLADTLHNFGDAGTAIPLWVAFRMVRRKPNRRFPYGYGRVEDLAGVVIILVILTSAVIAGYESVQHLLHPRGVQYLWAVVAASIIGFLGNEAVAVWRIRVGKQIHSAALVADGYHARVDGLTSLGVLVGAVGVWLGFPLADPLVGIAITAMILWIVWQSGKAIFTRLLDGVEPDVMDQVERALAGVEHVKRVREWRARWAGHRLYVQVTIAVDPALSLAEGHAIAHQVGDRIEGQLKFPSGVAVHVEPEEEALTPEPSGSHAHGGIVHS